MEDIQTVAALRLGKEDRIEIGQDKYSRRMSIILALKTFR
jgi:hypothetical protein